tara:strand:- start:1265 stop:1684 length:420 start_codon:yes stop_codon:yes gene_type:complete
MELPEITLPLILSLWGAVLSSILGLIKIKEAWSNRFKIEIISMFRSDPDYGNDIVIQNLSGKAVLLNYMELFYKKDGFLPFKKEIELWSPEDELLNSKIESQSNKPFTFALGDHFTTESKTIYVRLYFAGNKEIVKKVG